MPATKQPLGQLLIAREQLTPAGLDNGLQAQLVTGTRIGTVLVQQEVVRLDAVSDALSAQHGVPAVPQQLLDDDSAVDAAVQQVTGALCDRHAVVPLLLEAGTLHLAMCDPSRRLAGEISFELGLPIKRYVVPELRLMYLLERWYGIPRDPRFLRAPVQQAVGNERRTYISATVRPLPETPAIDAADLEQTLELVYLDEYEAPAEPGGPAARTGSREEVKEDLVIDLVAAEGDSAPEPDDADLPIDVGEPETSAPAPDPGFAPDPEDELPIDVDDPVHAPNLIDVVVGRLEEAETGDVLARLLVQPVLEGTAVSVLFWVKERWAVGCCSDGTSVRQEELQRLVVPLDSPSLLQWAHQRKMVLKADGARDAVLQEVAAQLGLPALGEVCAAPVLLHGEVVNLVCFMSSQGTLFSEEAPYILKRLIERGSAAYRRLVGKIRG